MGLRSGVYGLSQADASTTDGVLDLGRRHPSTHGMTRLRLECDGETVVAAEVLLGSMHRGAEKLFESRDYRQVLALTDRHDWLSAPGSEAGAAMAMEFLLGIEVPTRAQLLRMLASELSRIAAHAAFLAEFPWTVVPTLPSNAEAVVAELRAMRERCLDLLCELTGARMHVMWTVIGGVRNDVDASWLRSLLDRMSCDAPIDAVTELLECAAVKERLNGVGVLPPKFVDAYAMSGVVARASGSTRDARRDNGYALYSACTSELTVPSDTAGDTLARLTLLVAEMRQSCALLKRIIELLHDTATPVNVQLPKVVRLPEGSVYTETENALGINGYWLVSRGDKMPHRLKIRSASFNNLAALADVLIGSHMDDVVPSVATWFFLSGDADR